MGKIRLKIKKKGRKEEKKKRKGKKAARGEEELADIGFDFSDIEGLIKDIPPEGRRGIEIEEGGRVPEGEIDTRLRGVEEKLGRMETEISSTKSSLEALSEKITEIEANIRKLLDIYELVIKEINPFVEPGTKKGWDATQHEEEKLPLEDLEEFDLSDIDLVTPDGKREKLRRGTGEEERERRGREAPYEAAPKEFEEIEPEPPSPKEEWRHHMEKEDLMKRLKSGQPILSHLPTDYRTMILVFRWIEFLFERVTRDKIGMLLEYYKDVGWISDEVKSKVMAFARGEIQDVTKYEPTDGEPGPELFDKGGTALYKKVSDWRLSADDHLKSLLFILKIAGIEVNKDIFNAIEQEIKMFKQNLEEYYGV
ncbi:MAG: flagella protein [Thermoplasmata archaeon]|nr:flagella protein [Thermoplasmata archaeon]